MYAISNKNKYFDLGFFSMDEMFRLGDLSDFWGMQLICGTYPYLQNFDLFKLHLCPNK